MTFEMTSDTAFTYEGERSFNLEAKCRQIDASVTCLVGTAVAPCTAATGAEYCKSLMKNVIFWDVTSCGSCKNRLFGGTCRLHHQGDHNRRARNNVSSKQQQNYDAKK
jgi:hypothetical protein